MKPEISQDEIFYAKALATLSKPSRRIENALRILNAAYWSTMIFLAAVFVALIFDREIPIEFSRRELVTSVVYPGQQLDIRSDKARTRICEGRRQYTLVDGAGRRHEFVPISFEAGGILGFESDVTGPIVPLDAAEGEGRLLTVISWECNPLQKMTGWSIKLVPPLLHFKIVRK